MIEKKPIPVDFLFGEPLFQWWETLVKDRASRATLRRCSTLHEVAMCPAYQKFYRYMLIRGWPEESSPWEREKLAAIAGLLSHVEEHVAANLPKRMSGEEGETLLLSELRFRALLKIDTTDDLFVSLRRALPLIKHKTNIKQLALDVYRWNDRTKKDWAYSYSWPIKQSA